VTPPTTLRALRAAIARILVARGERPDALRVAGRPCPTGRAVVIHAPRYHHPLAVTVYRDTAAEAVAAAWALVVERCAQERTDAAGALVAAEARVRRAEAACAACGGGE
jgi:hypothetical protein